MYKTAKRTLLKFIRMESLSGILILLAAVIAVVFQNSTLSPLYDFFLTRNFSIELNGHGIEKPILLWINDGLMGIFFLLVSLEIKREIVEGQLSSRAKISLPAIAAIGGIIVPALIYMALNHDDPIAIHGWGIPIATDIAFAICVISLLGTKYVPAQLKAFLLAIAIIDDIAAILIIALFYTTKLSMVSIVTATIAFLVLISFNLMNVKKSSAYVVVGIILWSAVLKSGIHATVAGVLVAATIPINVPGASYSPLKVLEEELHPWVVYGVMPLFAFANAGVSLKGITFNHFFHALPLGIITGLFFGKATGIFSSIYLAVKCKFCELPEGTTWPMILALGIVCGVGFTMSLFIGNLAFNDPELNRHVRLGVITGSTLSAVVGYLMFRFIKKHTRG